MSEHYDDSEDSGISEEFHKHFWKYAIGGIIVIFIGVVAYKLVDVLTNNAVAKSAYKIFGEAGILLSDLTQGCCPQSDCKTFTLQNDCNQGCGCTWTGSSTDEKGKVISAHCIQNDNGMKVGDGGITNSKCYGFWGLIAGLGALFVLKLISLFRKSPAKTLEEAFQRKGMDPKEGVRGAAIEGRGKYLEKVEELNDHFKDDPEKLKSAKEYLSEKCMIISNNRAVDQMIDSSSPDYKAAAEESRAKARSIKLEASKEGLSEEDIDMLDKHAEEDFPDPFPEK